MKHVLDKLKITTTYHLEYYRQQIETHIVAAHIQDLVDFPCHFDESGTCIRARSLMPGAFSGTFLKEGCCCSQCASNLGYLNTIPQEDMNYYKKRWNQKFGFFEKGKGCKLDKAFRSSMCLKYKCRFIQLNKKDELIMQQLSHLFCR
jgi:hypothetical protein